MTDTPEPGLGFMDRIKGKAKGLAGAVTGDDALRREGELHEERADALVEARDLEAEADRQQGEADIASRQQELDAQRKEVEVEEAADARRAGLDQERNDAEAAIADRIAQKERGIEAQADAEQTAADRDQAEAAWEHGEDLREAAATQTAAERARAEAALLDATIQTTKEQ